MPRTVQEILGHSEELAARFKSYEPAAADERDPAVLTALREAVLARSAAERDVRSAVEAARAQGWSWAFVGTQLGTSGEAARQRYNTTQPAHPTQPKAGSPRTPDDRSGAGDQTRDCQRRRRASARAKWD